jgi:SAM-dependent methyltransferase
MRVCWRCDARFESAHWRCPGCGAEPPADGYRRFIADLPELNGAYDTVEFDAVAAAEPASFWFRVRNELVVWALRTDFPEARSLFEVGCGTGIILDAVSAAFPSLSVSGGDAYAPALEHARRRLPGIELLQLDARRLPFDREFDVIAALDVLEHIDDDEGVLVELHRSVRPGGGVLLTVPQHRWLWSAADEWALHHRRYRRAELRQKVERSGFTVLRQTSFVSLLLPLMTASRLRRRDLRSYDPVAELRLPRWLDTAFGRIVGLDLALIRHGISLPVGGSLLLVAQRPPES